MNRGKIVIVIIVGVALLAAGFSTWYHYRNQHRAQNFWGATTALLIDKAPDVAVLRLGTPGEAGGASAAESPEDEPPAEEAAKGDAAKEGSAKEDSVAEEPKHPSALEYNETVWGVVDTKDAKGAKGIANLRRALILDTTYDWSTSGERPEPKWQYAVSLNDGQNWAAVLFDFDTRQIALTGGKKTALLEPEANAEFKQFFGEQFPGAAVEKVVAPAKAEEAPAAKVSEAPPEP